MTLSRITETVLPARDADRVAIFTHRTFFGVTVVRIPQECPRITAAGLSELSFRTETLIPLYDASPGLAGSIVLAGGAG
jgi:hypothetical protein